MSTITIPTWSFIILTGGIILFGLTTVILSFKFASIIRQKRRRRRDALDQERHYKYMR